MKVGLLGIWSKVLCYSKFSLNKAKYLSSLLLKKETGEPEKLCVSIGFFQRVALNLQVSNKSWCKYERIFLFSDIPCWDKGSKRAFLRFHTCKLLRVFLKIFQISSHVFKRTMIFWGWKCRVWKNYIFLKFFKKPAAYLPKTTVPSKNSTFSNWKICYPHLFRAGKMTLRAGLESVQAARTASQWFVYFNQTAPVGQWRKSESGYRGTKNGRNRCVYSRSNVDGSGIVRIIHRSAFHQGSRFQKGKLPGQVEYSGVCRRSADRFAGACIFSAAQ